jgi:hypothetical protein
VPATARPEIANVGSISGAGGTADIAKASFEAIDATKRTIRDRRVRDHFLFMVDLSAFFGVRDAPTKHLREDQKLIPKTSRSAMLICPK